MKYASYTDYDIHLLFSEVRSVSDNPYTLHAAFLLSCLFEAYTPDEDEEETDMEHTWGWKIPKGVLYSIVKNANEQFIYAAENGLQIDIWNKGYSIRKVNTCDKSRLCDIFNFKQDNDDYIVNKDGIMNLSEHSNNLNYQDVKDDFRDNKAYLRKVVMIAEDDLHNGWDNLTDMETTLYLWASYCCKNKGCDYNKFRKAWSKELYTTPQEDKACWSDKALLLQIPSGLYIFSAKKIRSWNLQHRQKSIVDKVNIDKANEYWFNSIINKS